MCCTLFHCLCTYKATISNNGIIQMQVFVATRNKPEFFVHESKVACHVLNTYLLCCSVGKGFLVCLWVCE